MHFGVCIFLRISYRPLEDDGEDDEEDDDDGGG